MPASADASEIISSIALISLCMNCVRSNPTYCAVSEILFTPIPLFSRFFISFFILNHDLPLQLLGIHIF